MEAPVVTPRRRFWRRATGMATAVASPAVRGDVAGLDERDRVVTRAVRRLLYTPAMLRLFGHMILAVAVKT